MDVASYLQARDPSVLAYNRPNLHGVNLINLMNENSMASTVEITDVEDKFMNVYLRIRGDIAVDKIYQIDGENVVCNVPKGSFTLKNVESGVSMKRTYSFTKIFGPSIVQQTVFNSTVKPKLLSFINGRSSTLFTYGASGSGKTFTIVGTPEEPGLIPRGLEYVFRSIPGVAQQPEVKPLPNGQIVYINKQMMQSDQQFKSAIINATLFDQASHIRTYSQMQDRLSSQPVADVADQSDISISIWVSFAEIYNEIIYDLLTLPTTKNELRPRLALGKTSEEHTYIKKLNYINVQNGLEAYQILQYGLHNLNYAATAINSHSSRSHCIFTIRLVQSSETNSDVYVSSFNFCDLAGSERLKKTLHLGDRLKESTNINASLLVLGRCMENIRKCQRIKEKRPIPFRESKLTLIFQKALSGNENVDMIVNINPSRDMFDETIHVLNFSAIAKCIMTEEDRPKPMRKENRFSLLMQNEETGFSRSTKNEETDIDALQRDYDKAKQQIRRQKEILSKKDDEIKRLHAGIDQIIHERDSVVAEWGSKIKTEKEYTADVYKNMMARREERFKEDKENAIASIRQEYENKIAALQVITISSDDEEEDSPQKSYIKPRKELEEQIVNFEALVDELTDKLKEGEDLESLLEDAKEQYRLLKTETEGLETYRQRYNEMMSENVALREELDSLKEQLLHRSVVVQFEDSDSDEEF